MLDRFNFALPETMINFWLSDIRPSVDSAVSLFPISNMYMYSRSFNLSYMLSVGIVLPTRALVIEVLRLVRNGNVKQVQAPVAAFIPYT